MKHQTTRQCSRHRGPRRHLHLWHRRHGAHGASHTGPSAYEDVTLEELLRQPGVPHIVAATPEAVEVLADTIADLNRRTNLFTLGGCDQSHYLATELVHLLGLHAGRAAA